LLARESGCESCWGMGNGEWGMGMADAAVAPVRRHLSIASGERPHLRHSSNRLYGLPRKEECPPLLAGIQATYAAAKFDPVRAGNTGTSAKT